MNGKLTISRASNVTEEDVVTFELSDTSSALNIARWSMTLPDFAQCLMGLSRVPVDITRPPNQYTIDRIGKTRETKTVRVSWKHGQRFEIELSKLIEPHLIDDWELHSDGIGTQQRGEGHNIILRRFVDKPQN